MNPLTPAQIKEIHDFLSKTTGNILTLEIKATIPGYERRRYVKAIFYRGKKTAVAMGSDSGCDTPIAVIQGWKKFSGNTVFGSPAERFLKHASEVLVDFARKAGAQASDIVLETTQRTAELSAIRMPYLRVLLKSV